MFWRQGSDEFENDGFIPPVSATIRQDPPVSAIFFGEKVLTAFSAGLARGLNSLLAFLRTRVVIAHVSARQCSGRLWQEIDCAPLCAIVRHRAPRCRIMQKYFPQKA